MRALRENASRQGADHGVNGPTTASTALPLAYDLGPSAHRAHGRKDGRETIVVGVNRLATHQPRRYRRDVRGAGRPIRGCRDILGCTGCKDSNGGELKLAARRDLAILLGRDFNVLELRRLAGHAD